MLTEAQGLSTGLVIVSCEVATTYHVVHTPSFRYCHVFAGEDVTVL